MQVAELVKLGRDEYLRRADAPVLIALPARIAGEQDDLLSRPLSGPLMRATLDAAGALAVPRRVDDDADVHWVRKRPNATFLERVGIGRTANNDIVLPFAGVSKYHAYFTRGDDGAWHVSDAGSHNGTFVGSERIAEAQGRPVEDDEVVRFGPYAFLFLTPLALTAFLERRAPEPREERSSTPPSVRAPAR
jgi:hypothetical protein